MVEKDIITLMEKLGMQNIKSSGEWVACSCPFAGNRHEKGSDTHPSFGIKIGATSSYNCLACGVHGPVVGLPASLTMVTRKNFSYLSDYIIGKEGFETGEVTKYFCEPIPEIAYRHMKTFSFTWKHITPELSNKYDVRLDKDNMCIVFVVRDRHGRVVGLKARAVKGRGFMSYTDLSPNNTDPKSAGIWYGEHDPLVPNKHLVLVEGERDRILLKEAGISNVWASMGASVSKQQLETIQNTCVNVVIFFDDDKGGKDSKEKLYQKLKKLTSVYEVTDYQGCNDPAEACETGKIIRVMNSIKLIGGLYV